MKKTVCRVLASALFLAGGAMFFGTPTASAQSNNHCQNKCEQAYRRCVDNASNPGALNQCGKAYTRCLATCG